MRMRTSSFSNKEVIGLISQYFVPVWIGWDDYGCDKKPAEQDEASRIRSRAGKLGLVAGNVNVYLLDPQGEPVQAMGVSKAMEPENLLPMLTRFVRDKQLKPRTPEAIRATARTPPPMPKPKTEHGLVLHVWTRYLPPGEVDKGTTDDWLELSPDEWGKFLPGAGAQVGASWDVPRQTADKLYQYFYPAVCHYDARASKIRQAELTATLAAANPKETQITLQGHADLDHSRDGSIDGRVTARMIGLVRFDPAARIITSFEMVSERADYVWHWQGKPSPSRIAIVVDSEHRADSQKNEPDKSRTR
jgi:hypothetical protein